MDNLANCKLWVNNKAIEIPITPANWKQSLETFCESNGHNFNNVTMCSQYEPLHLESLPESTSYNALAKVNGWVNFFLIPDNSLLLSISVAAQNAIKEQLKEQLKTEIDKWLMKALYKYIDFQKSVGKSIELSNGHFHIKPYSLGTGKPSIFIVQNPNPSMAFYHDIYFLLYWISKVTDSKWAFPFLDKLSLESNVGELKKTTSLFATEINQIYENVLLQYAESDMVDCNKHKGICLYGLPGTGKSGIVKAFSKIKGLTCLFFGPSTYFLKGKVGEGEEELRKVFKSAYENPHLLHYAFFDEFDIIGESRDKGKNSDTPLYQKSLQTEFLVRLDNRDCNNLIVFIATNFKSQLDNAVIRWGRVSYHFLVPELTNAKRNTILQNHKRFSAICPVLRNQLVECIRKNTFNFNLAMLDELICCLKLPTECNELYQKSLLQLIQSISKKYLSSTFNASLNTEAKSIEDSFYTKLHLLFLNESIANRCIVLPHVSKFVIDDFAIDRSAINIFDGNVNMGIDGLNAVLHYFGRELIKAERILLINSDFLRLLDDDDGSKMEMYLDQFYREESLYFEKSVVIFMVDELIDLQLEALNDCRGTSSGHSESLQTNQSLTTSVGNTYNYSQTDSKNLTTTLANAKSFTNTDGSQSSNVHGTSNVHGHGSSFSDSKSVGFSLGGSPQGPSFGISQSSTETVGSNFSNTSTVFENFSKTISKAYSKTLNFTRSVAESLGISESIGITEQSGNAKQEGKTIQSGKDFHSTVNTTYNYKIHRPKALTTILSIARKYRVQHKKDSKVPFSVLVLGPVSDILLKTQEKEMGWMVKSQ